ncbi:hypothetical protein [Ferviditalea candida]|uniref:Uncharacterized protein n=1 Tax=Ferviditalea candida TaxID=3108399 RepID=A0ABU5ZGS9_9BACL|nr:hypothetical protein [Paenibacillaceae bacterium T2]
MRAKINRFSAYLILLFVAAYYVNYFVKLPALNGFMSFLALLFLLICLPRLPGKSLLFMLVILFLSFSVSYFNSSPTILWDGLRQLESIIPIIVVSPVIGFVFAYRKHFASLLILTEKWITKKWKYFFGITILSHLICSLMVQSGIITVYQLINSGTEQKGLHAPKEFQSTAIIRGYTLMMLWSVFSPGFAYASQNLGVNFVEMIMLGIGLALIGIVISVLIYYFKNRDEANQQIQPDEKDDSQRLPLREHRKRAAELVVLFALLILLIVIFVEVFAFPILTAVPIVVLFTVVLYFGVFSDIPFFIRNLMSFVRNQLSGKYKELTLLFVMGVFITALEDSGLAKRWFELFLSFVGTYHLNVYIFLVLMVIFIGAIGFPPIPLLVIIANIISTIPIGKSPELFMPSLLIGTTISLMLSPVTVPLMIMSNLNGLSMLRNGFVWNYMFGIVFLLVSIAYILLLEMLL